MSDRRLRTAPFTCRTTVPRRKIAAMEKGPGPARYELPSTFGYEAHDQTKKRNPAFSLSKRLKYKIATTGPGPAVYSLNKGLTRFGREALPFWSLAARFTPPRDKTVIPGPGTYDPLTGIGQGPSFSLGGRLRYKHYIASPAPNTYTLPPSIGQDLVSFPSDQGYSIRGRPKFGSFTTDHAKTPGPARYSEVPMHLFKYAPPFYSFGGRTGVSYKTLSPGPATYDPSKVVIDKPAAPKFSFGCKHSEYVAPVHLDAD